MQNGLCGTQPVLPKSEQNTARSILHLDLTGSLVNSRVPFAPFPFKRLAMTPEERWIKIESAIEALLASQAQHEGEIAENRNQIAESHKQLVEQITRLGEQWDRRTSQIDAQIEKNTAAIRDLIAVSRTVVDAQRTTENQLQQLLKTLDAFIKGFQKQNGNQ
jgi:hypothetical protein